MQESAGLLGTRKQVKARLSAVRGPEEGLEQRQHWTPHTATQHGRRLSAAQQELARGVFMVSNVPAPLLSKTEAGQLLRLRGQRGPFYKLCTSEAGQVAQGRASLPWTLLCALAATLLGGLIQHRLLLVGTWQDPFGRGKQTVRCWRTLTPELARAGSRHGCLLRVLQEVRRCLTQGSPVTRPRTRPRTAQQVCDGLQWA